MRLPQGETLLEAQTRALAFFAERMPHHLDQTIVVIAHGAVGHAILVNALGGTIEDLWLKERIDNCQISRLEWTAADSLKLIELADVRHLADVGSLRSWRTTDGACHRLLTNPPRIPRWPPTAPKSTPTGMAAAATFT
jgi:broad specificity phosphatase PhoE